MAFRFMQTISFIYLLIVLSCTALIISHDEECLALFEFKQTILHQPYASLDVGGFHKLDSWKKIPSNASEHVDYDCCFWDGVVCSNKGVHVIELNLSQSSLRGPINSNTTLFNLAHLQMLDLSMNYIVESQIPSEIARLKQLRILDFSDSGFIGQIPSEISHLVQLTWLDLGCNPLKLQSPSLEQLLHNLTRLELLQLSGVSINSSVPIFLANISSLRSIGLHDCRLRDEFPSAIFHLPKLKFLSIGNNPKLVGFLPEFHNTTLLEHVVIFETGFGGNIPESIGKLNHLIFLNLGTCSFSGNIPSSFSNLTQLTYLFINQNELTGLVPSLESLSKLSVLDLGGSHFEKRKLLDRLTKLTNLKYLNVDDSNVYEEIPPTFANLTKLSFLLLRGNFIFGQIPSSFMNITTLEVIHLLDNQLHGPISSVFSNFKSLRHLDLASNKFNDTEDLDTFVGLDKFRSLDLGDNKISFTDTNNYTDRTLSELRWLGLLSCNLKEFPAFLHFQKKMSGQNLHDNKIEGVVPKWIWNNSQ